MKTQSEIDAALDELEAWVPTMLAQTDEASQMDAFAGRADLILDEAGEHGSHVRNRISRILVDNCMVPADEGPCA